MRNIISSISVRLGAHVIRVSVRRHEVLHETLLITHMEEVKDVHRVGIVVSAQSRVVRPERVRRHADQRSTRMSLLSHAENQAN
jgi:hypothetical protein